MPYRFVFLFVLTVSFFQQMNTKAYAQWEDYAWNPAPAEGDVNLPLPCGGSIALAQVPTSLASDDRPDTVLEDRRVILGSNSRERGFIEFSRVEHLSAPFLNAQNERYYLIGKYEVTEAQYQAVLSDDCSAVEADSGLPVVDISWYDAVEFTRKLNRFWFEQHADSLPRNGNRLAFARLPTEAEWEFAARGGLRVSEGEFQDDVFPFSPNKVLYDYAFYNDAESSQGELNEIGILLPNPSGLHDILGNVSEMVFEPFRLNRAGRLHGMVGGFIAKGGSYKSEADSLRSAARTEYGYFNTDTGTEQRSSEVGFRIVVSAQALPDLQSFNSYGEAWQQLGEQRADTSRLSPVEVLETLAQSATDLQFKRTLENLSTQIVTETAERTERSGRLMRTILQSGAQSHQQVCEETRGVRLSEKLFSRFEELVKSGNSRYENEMEKHKVNLARQLARLNETIETYVDTVLGLRNDYSDELMQEQAEVLKRELIERFRPNLANSVQAFFEVVRDSRVLGLTSKEKFKLLIAEKQSFGCR